MNINSSRIFTVAYLEDYLAFSEPALSLDKLLSPSGDWEYIYALREELDKILDLKVGERLMISFNRDNKNDSQGFIKRIR